MIERISVNTVRLTFGEHEWTNDLALSPATNSRVHPESLLGAFESALVNMFI